MNISEIIKKTKPSQRGGLSIKINNDPNLKKELFRITNFLPTETVISVRFYYILNNLSKPKKCLECNIFLIKPQNKFCSEKCNAVWHSKNTNKLDSLKDAGSKYLINLSENEKKTLNEKRKKTLQKRYGVDHNFKIPEVKKKRKETWMKNWGVDNPHKSPIIQDKINSTNIKRYGGISPFSGIEQKEKRKETWMKNWGVDNPSKSKIINDKKIEESLVKWGFTHPSKHPDIKKKQFDTWIKNRKLGKHKKYEFKIYEFKNSGRKIKCQGDEIKALDNYIIKTYKEEDIINDISFMNILNLTYWDSDKKLQRRYIPDFYIKSENLIIEVKSKYFYNLLINNIYEKAGAVISKGYNFILMINYGENGKVHFINKTYEEIKADIKKIRK